MIFPVMPVSEYAISNQTSFRDDNVNVACFFRNGKRKRGAIANRKNASVNGGMFVRDILNMTDAALQMMFAMIIAPNAFWIVENFMGIVQEYTNSRWGGRGNVIIP